MKIVLASQSAVKVETCNNILPIFFENYELITIKAESGVAEQPVGCETLRGAHNRLAYARQQEPEADLYISIENGLFKEEDKHIDRAMTLVQNKNGFEISAMSDGVVFPEDAVNETRTRGFIKWTVGKVMQEMGIVTQHDDPQLELSGISQKEYLAASLTTALTDLKHKKFQPI